MHRGTPIPPPHPIQKRQHILCAIPRYPEFRQFLEARLVSGVRGRVQNHIWILGIWISENFFGDFLSLACIAKGA
jgi:hypothetical protein